MGKNCKCRVTTATAAKASRVTTAAAPASRATTILVVKATESIPRYRIGTLRTSSVREVTVNPVPTGAGILKKQAQASGVTTAAKASTCNQEEFMFKT
eukprot:jgi/Bigna1/131807/aug1.15_g6515